MVSGILDEGCVRAKGLPVEPGWSVKAVNAQELPTDPNQESVLKTDSGR